MAHELAGALQQAGRIRQRRSVKEPHVYVRREYIDVAEGRISQTCNRTAVMQQLPDFVPAFSHHLKPLTRDGSQLAFMCFDPRIDGGIALDSAVESQQFRSHHRSTFCIRDLWLHSTLTRGTKGTGTPSSRNVYGLVAGSSPTRKLSFSRMTPALSAPDGLSLPPLLIVDSPLGR